MTVCFVLLATNIIIRKGSLSFFLPGYILSIFLTINVITVVESHKKDNLNNIRPFLKIKLIYFIISLVSVVLLILGIIEVYYTLSHNSFPQAIGMDQAAYWRTRAPLVYLSYMTIIVNIFSWLILLSLPKYVNY
jgi:lysylphosphatidylglycerol synthetase-like protein (DUF2156 family)